MPSIKFVVEEGDTFWDPKEQRIHRALRDSLRALLKEKYVFSPKYEERMIEVKGVGEYLNFTHLLYLATKEAIKEYLHEIK